MLNWDQYAGTVLSAYIVSALIFVVLIGATLIRASRVKKRLDALKQHG